MTKDVYGLKIGKGQIETFEEILRINPCIEEIFRKDWIGDKIHKHYDNRFNIHSLFWGLLVDKDLPAKLLLLKREYNRFQNFINQIKSDNDNFLQNVANIDVFAEYRRKHQSVFFQPQNPESQKECDIKLCLDGIEFWGEILTVNSDEEERHFDKLNNDIRIAFNRRNKSENCVSLLYQEMPEENIKESLIEFILSQASMLTIRAGEKVKKTFQVNNKVICDVEFFKKGNTYTKGSSVVA